MKNVISCLSAVLMLSLTLASFASVEPLLKSDRSWDGGRFYYPGGKPEITSVKLNLQEGKDAPFHCHPIPTMGYISKGNVELETKSGKTSQVKEGDSVVEVMNTVHRGKAIDGDAEIIVFYAGAKNIPVTVLETDKKNFKKYCQ